MLNGEMRLELQELYIDLVNMSKKEKDNAFEFIKCRDGIELDETHIYTMENTIMLNFRHVHFSISTMFDVMANDFAITIYDIDDLANLAEYRIDESGIDKTIPDRHLMEFLSINEYAMLKTSIWHIIRLIEHCNLMLKKRNAMEDLIREYRDIPINNIY